MGKSTIETNEIDDNVYIHRKMFYIKLILLSIFIFIIGVITVFPIGPSITKLITGALTSNKNCKITHDKLQLSFFMPKLHFVKPNLPMTCINPQTLKRSKSISFKSWTVSFDAISFSPIGIRTKLLIKAKQTQLLVYPTLSFGTILFSIKDTKVNSNFINDMIEKENLMAGSFALKGVITTDFKQLLSAKVLIKSKNFSINKANIQGFNLTKLNIKNVSLKINLKDKTKLSIKQFILGDKDSPIIANLKGLVKLNQKSVNRSKLDLNAEIKFSQDFTKEYPFINLFFKGKKSPTGFYKLKLSGALGAPNPPKFL